MQFEREVYTAEEEDKEKGQTNAILLRMDFTDECLSITEL